MEAALELLDTQGAEGLSIRRLAARLGVSPMAVYRHVRDKDDLLAQVVDEVLARTWRPHVGEGDWRAWVEDAADRLRSFLVANPAALGVYLRRPVTSPAARARMEAMLHVLRVGLGGDRLARRAYAAVHTYTLGFASLEASRSSGAGTLDDDDLARELAEYTSPAQFRDGLSALLAGYVAMG